MFLAPDLQAKGSSEVELNLGTSLSAIMYFPNGSLRNALGVSLGGHFYNFFDAEYGTRLLLKPKGGLVSLELYLAFYLAPRFEHWSPRLGLEFGYSGDTGPGQRKETEQPDDLIRQVYSAGPGYVVFSTSPLRYQFDAWAFSALDLKLGTTIPKPGRVARLELTLVSISWRF